MLELIVQQLVVRLNSAVRPSVWLTILVVIFVPLERLFAVHPQKVLRKGIGADLGYYFLSSLLPALLLERAARPAGLGRASRRSGRSSGGDRCPAALGARARRAGGG